jgi:DNA-binding response OmpR family regulator
VPRAKKREKRIWGEHLMAAESFLCLNYGFMKDSQLLPTSQPPAALPQSKADPTPRILLVDDELHARELIGDVLIQSGYDVDTAADGADAWKALNETNYDLLITDNKMPRVTGLELILKLRSEEITLPVILASGTVPVEELKQYPWLQLDAMLPKPFTVAELLDTVKKVLLAATNSELFRDCAMKENKIPRARESAIASIRDRANSHQRILVVDDDRDTRQLSIDVLNGSGYNVDAAKDGAAGWEALQNNSYNLVITDNKMPRMTGLEMIEKLRSATMTLPVIMATRYLPTHEFVRRPWLKPDAALERPFSNEALLAAVKNVLGTDDSGDDRRETLLPKYL